MNHIRSTRRLSVALAGLAAAALALSACEGTATAVGHRPPHQHATHVKVHQTQTGVALADLRDIATVKRDLFWRLAQRPQDSGLVACAYPLTTQDVPATDYHKLRAQFAGSRWPDLRNAGTAYVDLALQLPAARYTTGYQTVWFYQRLSAVCAKHGRAQSPGV